MRLVGCDDRHAFERACECELVGDGVLVVVFWNDLLVVRIRTFDETREHCREGRPEAEVIVAPRDLELFVFRKQAANLVECLWWNDQVARWCARGRDGNFHLRETVAVG